MPKRIPTPEPGDDEPKYYTVVQPYPLNANWELPHDYITFGRWIAGCIGPDPFFALFYKPSARGQVILEINRDYPHPERLLGEHRWSEFLRKPSVEEAGRVSQIFYCVYSTGRQAQKDGWKRINVAESWFKNWSPVNPVIMHPYPRTAWCPLPPEDRTNKPMCRPLPVSVHPPPPVKAGPAPVVPGSAAWISQKAAPSTNTPAALKGAWAAKQQNGGGGNNKKKNGGKAIPANSAAPWHTATAPKSSNTIPLAKNTPSTNSPSFPPGLPPIVPPGIVRGPNSASAASSSSSAASEEAYLPIAALAAGFVGISISPSMEAHLYNDAVETSPDPAAYVADWEKMPVSDDPLWPSAGDVYTAPTAGAKSEWDGVVVENLWGEEDEDDRVKNPLPGKARDRTVLCTVHGIICKKGICKEYARLLREQERAEKMATEPAGAGGKGGWNKSGAGGRGSANSNKGGWKKKGANPWHDDDSGSATGSEGRSGGRSPNAPATDAGWATVAPKKEGWSTVRR